MVLALGTAAAAAAGVAFLVLDAHVQKIVGIAEMLGQPLQRCVAVDRDAMRVDAHCVRENKI